MRTIILALTLLLLAETLSAAATYTGPGTYAPADNCGFSVPEGAVHGVINLQLKNDSEYTTLWAAPGVYNNLRVKSFQLFGNSLAVFGGPVGPNSITIDDSRACGYTRSFSFQPDAFCETDPQRPERADPDTAPPGPDLPENAGFWSGNYGAGMEIDVLGFLQTDQDYWTTAQLRESQFWPGGVRRCRIVPNLGDAFSGFMVAQ